MKPLCPARWVLTGATGVVAGMMGLAPLSVHAQQTADKDREISVRVRNGETEGGLILSARATAKEVGLPLYPGAIPHKDEGKNDSAGKFGLWSNSFGFKLVVLTMESPDALKKVAEFYQKALARYGTVLDCTNAGAAAPHNEDTDRLTCADDRPERGETLLKVGNKRRQHIVNIQPNGSETIFQLVYIET
jgi:hypothetical protein